MKPKEAFGRYGCVPRDLHPAWLAVSWSARAIGMALFSLVDDFETRRIDIHGDWMDSLCKRLAIGGKERRFAKPALRSLVEVRLLTVHSTFIVVNTTPADSDGTSKSTQVPENNQVSLNSKQAAIKASERDARARESSARFERPPIPPAPPELPIPKPPPIRPEDRCWQLYQRALGTEHLLLAPNHHDALQALASAAKAEADGATHGEAFDRAAERILGVWMAEKYWQEKRPNLRNLKERLEAGKYAVPKERPKPILRAVDKLLTDQELLALPEFEEFTLSLTQKQRRWELILAKERREDEQARAATGVAS